MHQWCLILLLHIIKFLSNDGSITTEIDQKLQKQFEKEMAYQKQWVLWEKCKLIFSIDSVEIIAQGKLKFNKVSARRVPKQLSLEQ